MAIKTLTMYDSIDVNAIPLHPQAVAGYVGGNWPTYSPLVKKFPFSKHKSIAVSASEDAEILDIENGDASPDQAPAWVRRQLARGVKLPGVYADASTMPSVLAALSAAGIKRQDFVVWVADYNFTAAPTPPFLQGAEAVQWTDHALNRNLDASVCLLSFFELKPVPVVNPPHYDRFVSGSFPSQWGDLNERNVVEKYDRLRKHPLVHVFALRKLRAQLLFLADRVASEAINNPVNGKPSWGLFFRGYRYQQLSHRAHGMRFV